MRTLTLLTVLFLVCSCSSAQNLKIENAWHEVSLGGVRGARAERFTIIVKENGTVKPLHLMIGNIKIPLTSSRHSGNIILTGAYFPENQPTVTESGTTVHTDDNFDLNAAYLVSENITSKTEIRQKISFKSKSTGASSPGSEDVPE